VTSLKDVHLSRNKKGSLLQKFPKLSLLFLYTVKKVSGLLVPSWDVTGQTLPGRELLNYSRPGRVW
jgi:hypothetical protein